MVAQAKACMDANDSLASPRGGRRKAFQSVGLSVGIQQWEIDEHVKTGRVKIRKVRVRKRPMAIGQLDAAYPPFALLTPCRCAHVPRQFRLLNWRRRRSLYTWAAASGRKHAFSLSLSRGLSLGPRGPSLYISQSIICAFPLALA